MILYCLLNPLRLNADIPLRGGGGTMLQQPLYKGNIEAVGLVYLCCVPLAETVGADALKPQIVAYDFQLLLDCPLCDGKNQFCSFDPISQAIVFDILPDQERDCENPAFACLSS